MKAISGHHNSSSIPLASKFYLKMLRLVSFTLMSALLANAFYLPLPTKIQHTSNLYAVGDPEMNGANQPRRSFLSSISYMGLLVSGRPVMAEEEEETFASIAARAAQLSSEVGEKTPLASPKSDDPRTAYDFSLPVSGETLSFQDIVHQQYNDEGRARVKAILVINMKEDDPIARKDIPELISLASK